MYLGRASFHTDFIMYDVDDHCYGKKLVRHCPMTSLFQALRWYMIVMHRDLENRCKKWTGTGERLRHLTLFVRHPYFLRAWHRIPITD